jgi:co-chaperonin GroES (HSP10)
MTEEVNTKEVTFLKLPEPVGYKLLIAMLKAETTFGDTSIVRPEQFARAEEVAHVVGLVLKVGKEAYLDKTKFPNGPWCKKGDYVIMRSYSGTRFKCEGKTESGEDQFQEFRLINDDTVEGVVADPRGIVRA